MQRNLNVPILGNQYRGVCMR